MEIAEILEGAIAMSRTSPSYSCGTYRCTNREHMVITYRTDPAALERLIPKSRLADEPIVRCDFMRMKGCTGFGHYSGAHQPIRVRIGKQRGSYAHMMFLDALAPIAGDRELWGFPKKPALPTLRAGSSGTSSACLGAGQ